MEFLFPSARRVVASQWVCHSCRAIQRPSPAFRYRPLSTDRWAQELRDGGPARTRFAPSPTGYLHLGSLRTALFNYMIAKATGGQFILRIEDTDQRRTIQGAEEALFEDLDWTGIQWDEGPRIGGPYGPYKQSERTSIYHEHAQQLLDSNHAYRCFCTPERLRSVAETRNEIGLPAEYDRKCMHIPKEKSDERAALGEAHVVRLKMPDAYPVYRDEVYGTVRARNPSAGSLIQAIASKTFEDPILLKSDGFPTYHLANVVDDHLMKITHVVRGSEWIASTAKHVVMYKAFGWEPPKFAHVSLLVDKHKRKLSKREGAIRLEEWREKKGIFPEALNNYVALLGWSHNEQKDIMSMEQLIENASLKFTRGDTIVSFEKLWYLQKKHAYNYTTTKPQEANQKPCRDLNKLAVEPLVKYLEERNPRKMEFYDSLSSGQQEKLVHSLVWADAQNYTNPSEFHLRNEYFFTEPTAATLAQNIPPLKLRSIPATLEHNVSLVELLPLFNGFSEIDYTNWNQAEIKWWTNSIIDQNCARLVRDSERGMDVDEKLREVCAKGWGGLVHKLLRWALTAGKPGPSGAVTMEILGKLETMKRLKTARDVLSQHVEGGTGGPIEESAPQTEALS